MLMKVFNKGQIVIPAEIRRALGIEVGEQLEVQIDRKHHSIELHKPEQAVSAVLAGALCKYAKGKPFPTRKQMSDALKRGLQDG